LLYWINSVDNTSTKGPLATGEQFIHQGDNVIKPIANLSTAYKTVQIQNGCE
jgi:hypothetical protein